MKKMIFSIGLCLLGFQGVVAQTIAEKRAEATQATSDLDEKLQNLLPTVNQQLKEKRKELDTLYDEVLWLHQEKAAERNYQELLNRINAVREDLALMTKQWREAATAASEEDDYGLWHQPNTTLEQLIVDYGSQDYVYLIPPEVGSIKISVNSNLPIPRASWSEMLELILTQNGIGIRQLNPFLRELYPLKQTSGEVRIITNKREELNLFPREAQAAFVLSLDPTNVRRTWSFLNKFANPNTTVLQLLGRDILIITKISEIDELLQLHGFISKSQGEKEYKLVPLLKIDAEEMAKILGAVFDYVDLPPQNNASSKKTVDSVEPHENGGLQVMTLKGIGKALFLIGSKEEVNKAETVIREVEQQFGGPQDKTVFWYTAKHSEPQELADVLQKIYTMMVSERIKNGEKTPECCSAAEAVISVSQTPPLPPVFPPPEKLYHDSFYQDGSVAVNPAPVALTPPERVRVDESRHNFIVDPKTGSIVMVVEAEVLPKLKEVIKRLDVPKKMVQIEVLLVEKKLSNTTNYGLNLLKIGSEASQKNASSVVWNDTETSSANKGILEFIISKMKGGSIPAYDLTYNFLLSQEDVQINASPSVTTINQTPAKIAIVEEFSINTGVFEVETAGKVALKDSFTRAQYGITLEITPTIHFREGNNFSCCDGDLVDYITLETVVNFDTVQPVSSSPGRPNVTRRNIKNEVLIPDGQTVILGGLRRKNIQDSKEAIPFIGDLPGIGKLFSTTSLTDNSTEMFIFITPKIIHDPVEDLERIKYEQLFKRPGDIPEFLCRLTEAKEMDRKCTQMQSMRILFGRPPERCLSEGEYDGR